MIGLDTNILVRYFLQDDPAQLGKARNLLDHTLTSDNPGFVSLVSLTEMVWVLHRIYGFSSRAIAFVIESMLQAEALFLQNEREVEEALTAMKLGRGSFDDALIAALGTWAGCDRTVTFDRKAVRLGSFELL